jgi:hypothetical protein
VSIGTIFGVSRTTVYRATERFVEVFLDLDTGTHVLWPNDSQKLEIQREFENIDGFTKCVGAIDVELSNLVLV